MSRVMGPAIDNLILFVNTNQVDNQNSNQTQTVENALPQPPVSPIEQTAAISQPKADGPLAQNPKPKFLTLLTGGIIILLLAVFAALGFYLFKKSSNNTTPISTPVVQETVVKKNLNPNTGNLYEDIKVRLKEELK